MKTAVQQFLDYEPQDIYQPEIRLLPQRWQEVINCHDDYTVRGELHFVLLAILHTHTKRAELLELVPVRKLKCSIFLEAIIKQFSLN